eukprot:scaffold499_cov335-Pavlova_lutheri.AAC.34
MAWNRRDFRLAVQRSRIDRLFSAEAMLANGTMQSRTPPHLCRSASRTRTRDVGWKVLLDALCVSPPAALARHNPLRTHGGRHSSRVESSLEVKRKLASEFVIQGGRGVFNGEAWKQFLMRLSLLGRLAEKVCG